MAARYWVGGTGNWSDDTNHWAASSGGLPILGDLPTSSDDVFFDANSFSAGGQATLSKSSGIVSCDYLSLKDSVATGGATWYAGSHSTNVSGNSGWIFTGSPGSTRRNSQRINYYYPLTPVGNVFGRGRQTRRYSRGLSAKELARLLGKKKKKA